MKIDTALVYKLLTNQFPEWKDLSVRQIVPGGWDNRTFRLGEDKLVRLPSNAEYANNVEKEQYWLPKLAPLLPFVIPKPLAMGRPTADYPWPWSIYEWIAGETAASTRITDQSALANDLASFLMALHNIDTKGGPTAGAHNFYRGGSLVHYDAQIREAIALLKGKIEVDAAMAMWESALAMSWILSPVWVHGDISSGNLLMHGGKLFAVIDFGQLAIGDPACDLAIAWTFFDEESRCVFKQALQLDESTWQRGKAWALWKASIVAADVIEAPSIEKAQAWPTIKTILNENN